MQWKLFGLFCLYYFQFFHSTFLYVLHNFHNILFYFVHWKLLGFVGNDFYVVYFFHVCSFPLKNLTQTDTETITRRINQIICNFFVFVSLINSSAAGGKIFGTMKFAIYLWLFRYQSRQSPKLPTIVSGFGRDKHLKNVRSLNLGHFKNSFNVRENKETLKLS